MSDLENARNSQRAAGQAATEQVEQGPRPVPSMLAVATSSLGTGALQRKLSRRLQRRRQDSEEQAADVPLQCKLEVGDPGDPYEQEADRVADAVVDGGSAPIGGHPGQQAQRAPAEAHQQPSETEGAEDTDPSKAQAGGEPSGGSQAQAPQEGTEQEAEPAQQPPEGAGPDDGT